MSRPQNVPDYPDEIMSLPMFHPDICCREQAENYVIQHSLGDGSYIVRPNTENDPTFVSITISFSGNSTCNARAFIDKNSKGIMYFISDKLKFSTFNELLSYYREHRIHCKQGIDNLRLTRPLRRINHRLLQPRCSLPSIGENRRTFTTSSSVDEDQTDVKQPFGDNKDDRPNRIIKPRSQSQSNMTFNQPAATTFKHGGSLNSQTAQSYHHKGSKLEHSVLTRARSEDLKLSQDSSNTLHYANSDSIEQDPKSVVKCRPPAPLPRPRVEPPDDSVYYTSINATKDFYLETYQALKVTEQCECGLYLIESELALGWTIHRSHDPATMNHIFFQLGEMTTWDMPVELVSELTPDQVKFIIYLCREGKQSIPSRLRQRLDLEMGRRASGKKINSF